jgi:hypothetical protein
MLLLTITVKYQKCVGYQCHNVTSLLCITNVLYYRFAAVALSSEPASSSSLAPGDCMPSGSAVFLLCLRATGNIVISWANTNQSLWDSGSSAAAKNLVMQPDGNLVAYNSSGKPYWSTGTVNRGTGPYKARMQSDGNFVVYDSTNAALWATVTDQKREYCLI